nr:hypothetical protein [Pseudonocardia sp. C8]
MKKAGIIVAASAASLLAASPLAFAGDYAADSSKSGDHQGSDEGGHIHKSSEGLLGGVASGNNVNVPIQVCNNNVPVNALGVQAPIEDLGLLNGLTGALGVAGKGEAKSGDSTTNQSDSCAQGSGSGDSIN